MSSSRETNRASNEIEIIPPGVESEAEASSRVFFSTGSHRIRVVRLGPGGSLLLALASALALALGFIFLTGVFLVLVPIVLVLAAIAWLTGASGSPFRRFR